MSRMYPSQMISLIKLREESEMAHSSRRLVPRTNPTLLSIVIPAYNEEQAIPALRQRLIEFIDSLAMPTELILVDDGSTDGTLDAGLLWSDEDARIKVLGLARNFGHQAAVTAGLDVAAGDAIVVMDADLQDPPEVIRQMLIEYGNGYDVVYGRRASRRGDGWFKRLSAWCFYRLMRAFIHKNHHMPHLVVSRSEALIIKNPLYRKRGCY